MPELEIRGNYMDPIWILAVMHFPNDEELREKYYAEKFAECELLEVAPTGSVELESNVLQRILQRTGKTSFQEIVAKCARDAYIAGDVLKTLFGMYSFPDNFPEPSLRKAIFIVGKYAESNRYGDGSPIPKGRTKIGEYFDSFRNVAHLWAAMRLHQDFPIREQEEILGSQEAVRDFLGIAHTLQAFGCKFIPKRSSSGIEFVAPSPILDPDTIWKVPNFVTPLCPRWTKPPQWILDSLTSYPAPAGRD